MFVLFFFQLKNLYVCSFAQKMLVFEVLNSVSAIFGLDIDLVFAVECFAVVGIVSSMNEVFEHQ